MKRNPPRIDHEFWIDPEYTQRVTKAQWRDALLLKLDKIVIKTIARQLIALDIGCGVMEIRLKPIAEATNPSQLDSKFKSPASE